MRYVQKCKNRKNETNLGTMKYIVPFLSITASAAIAYFLLRDAVKEPPEEERKLILGYMEDGRPIFDEDCDVDKTLELWKEQSRLVRQSM